MERHVDDGGDVDEGIDDDVGCFQLDPILLSMREVDIADRTGTSRMALLSILVLFHRAYLELLSSVIVREGLVQLIRLIVCEGLAWVSNKAL